MNKLTLKYTPEQEAELKEGYTFIIGNDDKSYEERDDFMLKFRLKHDKTSRSLVAKLAKMGIYKAKPKISTVTGEKAETKEQIVGKIAKSLDMKEDELEGLDKSPKLTLVRLLKQLIKHI